MADQGINEKHDAGSVAPTMADNKSATGSTAPSSKSTEPVNADPEKVKATKVSRFDKGEAKEERRACIGLAALTPTEHHALVDMSQIELKAEEYVVA